MNFNEYGLFEIIDLNNQPKYSLGLEDYGFPYSNEYLESLESEDINTLTEEYLKLSYMTGTEAEEQKENIFKRIWNWIVNKIKAVWNFFFGVKGKNEETTAKKKVDENIQKLQNINKSSNDAEPVKPTVSKKVFPEIKEDPKVQELKKDLDDLYKKYAEVKKRHSVAQDTYNTAHNKSENLNTENKENKEKLNQYLKLFEENLIRKYEDEINVLNNTINTYKKDIAEANTRSEQLKTNAELDYDKEFKRKSEELKRLQKDLEMKRNNLEFEKKLYSNYEKGKAASEERIKRLQESIKRYEESNEETRRTLKNLKEEHSQLKTKIADNKTKIQNLKLDLEKIKSQELKSSQKYEDIKKQHNDTKNKSTISSPEVKQIENEIVSKTQDLAKKLNVKIPTEADIMKRLKYSTNPADINNTKINNEFYLASGLDLFQNKHQEIYDPQELVNIKSEIGKNIKNIHNNGIVTWISTDAIKTILEIDDLFAGLSNVIKMVIKPDNNDDEDDVLDSINDYIENFKKQEVKVKSVLTPDKWICGLDTNNTEEVHLGCELLQRIFHICFRIKSLTNYDKILKELSVIKKMKPNSKPAYANTIKEFQTKVVPCFDKSVTYYKNFRSLFINLISSDKLAQPYNGNIRFNVQVAKNSKDLYQTI